MKKTQLPLSVVICTYNRAHLVGDAIRSVLHQTFDSAQYEIVVVDNNSTDNTREVVESFEQEHPKPRYVFEQKQGLSHARNRGWEGSVGDYIAFLDDDARAPTHWLLLAQHIIGEERPAILGGPIHPYFDVPPPVWWKENYTIGDHHLRKDPGPLTGPAIVYGGNMICQRRVLERLGGFDANFGMKGDAYADGEETVLQHRVRDELPDAVIYAHPDLYVEHLTAQKKTSWHWIIPTAFLRGRYSYKRYAVRLGAGAPQAFFADLVYVLKRAAKLLFELVIGVWKRDRRRYKYPQNYFYEESMRHLRAFGKFYEKYFVRKL